MGVATHLVFCFSLFTAANGELLSLLLFSVSHSCIYISSAATVVISEGEFETVNATDALLYENIDSCLTVTYAYDTGVRSGGHAVLYPMGEQLNLTQMLELLNNMDQATIFYIMGCIEIWNVNYFGPGGINFTINGQLVNSVESIVPALGYNASSNAVLFDTTDSNSVDILFAVSPSRILSITVRATGQVIYNQTWPTYEPNIQENNMNSNELRLYHSICILIFCALAQFAVV